mmetsp:Transcript_41373/g.54390  ORF Transcript_41373/g.54390 Transcript_41373/m.54390 type:complete len:348 (+) Transcript_41373:177-1220(+)
MSKPHRPLSLHCEGWNSLEERRSQLQDEIKMIEDEKIALLLHERQNLIQEKANLELEKNMVYSELISPNDIIKLNIGGEKIDTRRDTLCMCQDSLLSSMFSGRWEESLPTDSDGRVFLDFNPEYFMIILDELRIMRLTGKAEFSAPERLDTRKARNYTALAEYLGVLLPVIKAPQFESKGDGSVSSCGKKATKSTGKDKTYSFFQSSVLPCDSSPIYWKVKVLTQRPNRSPTWMFIGVIKESTLGSNSFSSPTSFGWAGNDSGGNRIYVQGKTSIPTDGWEKWEKNDQAVMKLDLTDRILQMKHHRTGKIHTIASDSLTGSGWRIHTNIYNLHWTVEIQDVTVEDYF